MLLEAYFMGLDQTTTRLQALNEYIEDTEDLVNLKLDQHRNELIGVDLVLTAMSVCVAMMTTVAGYFGMVSAAVGTRRWRLHEMASGRSFSISLDRPPSAHPDARALNPPNTTPQTNPNNHRTWTPSSRRSRTCSTSCRS